MEGSETMTSYWSERAHIKVKTDVVMELIDNLTQKLIQPCNLRFFINEKPAKPTKNKNGLMVFCNLYDAPKRIRIESDLYQSVEFSLTAEEIEKHSQGSYVHRLVRLEPSKRYSIPKWATVVEGQIEYKEDEPIESSSIETDNFSAIIEAVADTYRVKKESENGNQIFIQMTSPEIMTGREFFDAEKDPKDAFKIIESTDEIFQVEPNLSKPLEAHSLLQEIKAFTVYKGGHFMIVFPVIDGEMVPMKLYKNKEKIGEFQIEAGKWNDLGVFTI